MGVQVAAASFNKGKLTMKACTFDRNNCGGRMFDKVLVKYFAEEFKSKTKLDPLSKPKAVLKLETEVEKIKKQMSANTNKLPLNIGKYIDREKGEHSSDTRDLCLMKLSKAKCSKICHNFGTRKPKKNFPHFEPFLVDISLVYYCLYQLKTKNPRFWFTFILKIWQI